MPKELRRLEERWGLALQSAGFGVWDLDVAAQRVHYSPQWKAMLGYADDDEADATTTWRERVHPDDLQPMLEALGAHLAQPASPSYETEFRLRAADGSWRWVLSRGRVVERDADGQPVRMVGTLTDMTDRREAEALRLARDRAEAQSRAKSEFLSRMSHELRTPLNAVLGFAQLLAQGIGNDRQDEQRRQVAHIERAGWQLLGLIDDVLDLARADSGQLELQAEAVPLAPLIDGAWASVAADAAARSLQFERAPVPAGAAVLADAARLQQVLVHLLGNAVRYNRDGGAVSVQVLRDATGWTLRIGDTGVGMSASQLEHLFEPFNRLGRTAAGSEGVGVGQVLARRLVEQMQGRLTVRSSEGVGSVFEIVLPAAR